jgi:hypothetical protein
MFRPLNCHGGCYFCLDTKVTKKSSQQKGFFAAQAFALQIRKNTGCKVFAPLRLPAVRQVRAGPMLRKYCYALSCTQAIIFS